MASPSFFHHGDSSGPRIIHVTQLLTGENYHALAKSMSMASMANNKLGFIDETLSKNAVLMIHYLFHGFEAIPW